MKMRAPVQSPSPRPCRFEYKLGSRLVNRETAHVVEVVELLPNDRAVLRNLTVEYMDFPYTKEEICEGFEPVEQPTAGRS